MVKRGAGRVVLPFRKEELDGITAILTKSPDCIF